MPAQTSMLHVRVDDQLKAQASDALAGVGLTLSDAVRILLTRVAAEGGLPAGLTADPRPCDINGLGSIERAGGRLAGGTL